MAFKTSEFVAHAAGRNGFSRKAHYQVEIQLPSFLAAQYPGGDLITFSAVSANIPAVNLETFKLKRGTNSYNEWYPYNVNYGDLSIDFLGDGEGKILTLFNEWINKIYPIATGSANQFIVPYKDEYVSPILTVKHFDPEGRTIAVYIFKDAFPERTGEINFNWGAFNDITTLNIEFKYDFYTMNRPINNTNTTNAGPPQPARVTRLPITPVINH